MKFTLVPLAAALAASRALAQQFTINTPTNVVVCQPISLTWVGGTPPYFLPGNQPGAPALQSFPQQTGNQLTWVVNIAAGTSIGLSLRDSTGNTVQSAPFDINPGPDTSCVGKDPSSSGSAPPANTGSNTGSVTGSSTGAAPTTTPSTTPSATTPAAPTSNTSSGTTSNTVSRPNASTSGSPSPSPTSGASVNGAHFGAAGVIGAAVIALLA